MGTDSGIAGMSGGQALDRKAQAIKLTWLCRWSVFISHKTGALIRAAVRMGALSEVRPGARLTRFSIDTPKISVSSRSRMTFFDVVGTASKRQSQTKEAKYHPAPFTGYPVS